MRKLISILICVCAIALTQVRIPGPGGAGSAVAAPTYITSSGYVAGTAPITTAALSSFSTATMLIALVASADPTTCSLSDANGNAWVFVSNSEADRSLGSGIWKSYAKLGGGQLVTTTGDTLTVSCGGSSFAEADLIAIKGNLAGSDPQDQSSYYAGSANLGTSQPGSITPVSNTLVLTQGCNLFGSGFAITGGYTIQDTDGSDHYCAFAILTPSAGATNPTWTFTVGFHATSEIVSVK